jgi:hypothetical protein
VLGPQGDGVQGLVGKRQGVIGGSPSYSDKQKHTAEPWTTRQPEYGPHGLGEHSSPSGTKNENIYKPNIKYIYILFRKYFFIYQLKLKIIDVNIK